MNWKGLFVKSDETEDTAPVSQPVTKTEPVVPYSTVGYSSPAPVANPSAFEGQLRESVAGRGSEYTRFRTACEELRSVIPDENTRLKTTFVSMKAMGLTKDRLVSGAKECIGALTQEKAEFESAMSSAFSSQVEGGMSRLTTIDKQIEEKLTQIGALQAEVERMRAEKGSVSAEVEQSRTKIDSARRDFSAAYGKLVDEINSDINRISSSL